MIPRYARPEMTAIWSPETKFRIWFEIEAHAADALAELGVIPKAAAAKVWEKGRHAQFDIDAYRRDRARGEARCHRVPDASFGDRRAGSALRASGHDVIGRARHLPVGAAAARRRYPDRRCRCAAGRAEAPRAGAQAHRHHRPQPRHPCRANYLRRQARRVLCRVRTGEGAVGDGARRRFPSAPFPAPSAPLPTSIRG